MCGLIGSLLFRGAVIAQTVPGRTAPAGSGLQVGPVTTLDQEWENFGPVTGSSEKGQLTVCGEVHATGGPGTIIITPIPIGALLTSYTCTVYTKDLPARSVNTRGEDFIAIISSPTAPANRRGSGSTRAGTAGSPIPNGSVLVMETAPTPSERRVS